MRFFIVRCVEGIFEQESGNRTERYLPSYEGCTARQMKRMTHMEGFAMDIRATAASGQWTGKPEVLLFDYKERNPLTYAAKMTAISVSECNAEMEETANG